jgi:hypothetical protein
MRETGECVRQRRHGGEQTRDIGGERSGVVNVVGQRAMQRAAKRDVDAQHGQTGGRTRHVHDDARRRLAGHLELLHVARARLRLPAAAARRVVGPLEARAQQRIERVMLTQHCHQLRQLSGVVQRHASHGQRRLIVEIHYQTKLQTFNSLYIVNLRIRGDEQKHNDNKPFRLAQVERMDQMLASFAVQPLD